MANHTHQKMNEALQRKNNLKSNQSSTYRDSLSRGYKAKTYIKKKKNPSFATLWQETQMEKAHKF